MRKTGLIAFDLDGTILDSRKQISQHCIAVLERCIRQGIWVVPATGRTVDGPVSYTHLDVYKRQRMAWTRWRQ